MLGLIAIVVAFAGGFAVGRIKNAKKLAAINMELKAVEAKAVKDAETVVAAVRARL